MVGTIIRILFFFIGGDYTIVDGVMMGLLVGSMGI